MRQCIEEHPFLSAVVGDAHTDKAYYERVPSITIEDHLTILPQLPKGEDPSAAISSTLEKDLDRPYRSEIPRWRIIVLPLQSSQVFITFSFSHTTGDGPTGVAFHRSFLKALRDAPNSKDASPSPPSGVVATPNKPLGAPFDTPERLPISWSFLLAPLLGEILPNFLANLLGLKASPASTDAGTWLGTRVASFDPETHRSKLQLREIDAPALAGALRAARAHDAKLTGVMLQLISRALSSALPDSAGVTNFVSQAAVNMRGSVGVPPGEMGEFASGTYVRSLRLTEPGPPLSEVEWAQAREATRQLAETASTLQDQAIGLLRYAPSVRKWVASKIGQERDSSVEMSNLGVVAPEQGDAGDGLARIVKMVFAQPGHVNGPPISFNFVSVKGGGLIYTATWPVGALGIPEEDEDAFVSKVCESLDANIRALSA